MSATLSGVTGTASLTVTTATLAAIALAPGSLLLPRGTNQAFEAIGVFSDATEHPLTQLATWASSNAAAGTISNAASDRGYFTNIYTGTAYPFTLITASFAGVTSASSRLTITPTALSSITVQPATVQVPTLRNVALKAYAWFTDGAAVEVTRAGTWLSDAPSTVFVSNAASTRGRATSLQEGTANASLHFGGLSGSRAVTVDDGASESIVTQGVGLTAHYYTGMSFNTFVGNRIEPGVNYNWSTATAPLGVGDTFSIRWLGEVEAPVTGTYTFFTQSDDGVRLWVNGTQLVNNWTNHASTENSGTIALTAGTRYPIRLEFYENGGHAVIQLRWQAPGIAKQLIPAQSLYPEN